MNTSNSLGKKVKDRITTLLVIVAVLLAGGALVSTVSADPIEPTVGSSSFLHVIPADHDVAASLASFYAPSGDFQDWADHVCDGMTKAGCDNFLTSYGPITWDAMSNVPVAGSSVVHVGEVAILENGNSVHQYSVHLVLGADVQSEAAFDVYAEISQTDSGEYLLEAIHFDADSYTL